MSRRPLVLLLAALAVLFAGFAGVSPAVSASAVAFAPADLQAGDLSRAHKPALTRAGFAMAVVESSRRKARMAQRPPAESPILTSRFMAEGLARSDRALRPWSILPLEPVQTERPFPARGPPAWNFA